MRWTWLPACLVLGSIWCLVIGKESDPTPSSEWEDWGSGFQEELLLLHDADGGLYLADSPFVADTPGQPANCTQRFWLPSSIPLCTGEEVVGPEEFEEARLMALQNRAALQAVSLASGLEEGGPSYQEQAHQDVQVVRADHQEVVQTAETMEKVFFSLEEKRREAAEHYTFSSLKEHLTNTKASITSRAELAALLEGRLSMLERSLDIMQLQLVKLLGRRW